MAWIESHQSLAKHRKTLRAAGRLSVDRATLIGHLHLLWWWGLDNVPADGHLGDISDFEIAEAAEWKGDPSEFVSALIEAGFIDVVGNDKYLHDWYDYAGKLLEKREKERERSRQRRANDQRETSGQNNGRPADDQETLLGTVPNRTVPNLENISPPRAGEDVSSQAASLVLIYNELNPVSGAAASAHIAKRRREIEAALKAGCTYEVLERLIRENAAAGMAPWEIRKLACIECGVGQAARTNSKTRGDPVTVGHYAPGQDPNKELVE